MERKKIAISMTNSHLLNTGLGEFENSIATRLAQRAPMLEAKYGIRIVFIVEGKQVGAYGDSVDYQVISTRRRNLLKYRLFSPMKRLLIPHYDLLHWTNQFFKFKVKLAPKQLITVHDANYLHNDITAWHKRKKTFIMNRRLKQATHLSFISYFTEKDIKENFKITQPSRVIYNGVTNLDTLHPDDYRHELDGMNVTPGYLLHISRWSRKKNVLLMVEMMQYLPNEQLVIAGSGSPKYKQRLVDTIERLQLKNVAIVGQVSTQQKAALLSGCKAMLFPSRSEGFGLPVVEAMCFGKPSFLSQLTSLPEVGGDVSYYFKSFDALQMAETIKEGLADFQKNPEAKAAALKARAAIFDWDKTVDDYIDYYLDILGIDRT